MKNLCALMAVALLAAACTSTPTAEQPGATVEDRSAKPATPSTTTRDIPTVTTIPGGGSGLDPRLKDPNNILSKRSVYFDYDKDTIRDEFRPMLDAHARYLRENRAAKILVQGNTDERGSREYNLALGQRRADAVKKVLVLLGATELQIESVSLGKEKQVCTEATEDCYAKNRRVDIIYVGE